MLKYGCWLMLPAALAAGWYFWPEGSPTEAGPKLSRPTAVQVQQTVETPPPLPLPPDLPSLPLPPVLVEGTPPAPLILTGSSIFDLPLPPLPPLPTQSPNTPSPALPPIEGTPPPSILLPPPSLPLPPLPGGKD
jgi:hypothetical protein